MADVLENTFKVKSSDEIILEMTEKALLQSVTLGNLVEALDYSSKKPEKRGAIPLSKVNGVTLQKVIEWCEKHRNDAIVDDREAQQPRNIRVPEWDAEFFKKLDNEELFEVICAANYLDIKTLLNFGCKTVADMAKGKSPEELRMMFDIPTDEEDAAAEKAAKEAADADAATNN